MRTKLSERNIILSLILFIVAIALLLTAKLFNGPVRISEKGIVFIVLAIMLSLFALRLLKKSIIRF